MKPESRLSYRPVSYGDAHSLHALLTDPYVRRYLLDGLERPLEWTLAKIHESQKLFERDGVGLYLCSLRESGELVGFCGFGEYPDRAEPIQLLYGLLEKHSGKGLGTEMVRHMMLGQDSVAATVDAPNISSVRLLEKLGFQRKRAYQGPLGELYLYCWP